MRDLYNRVYHPSGQANKQSKKAQKTKGRSKKSQKGGIIKKWRLSSNTKKDFDKADKLKFNVIERRS
jgi:hypothetical protein